MRGSKPTFSLEKSRKPGDHDLKIAGVLLRIALPPSVRLRSPGKLYFSFKAKLADADKGPAIAIRLVEGSFPSLEGLEKRFDTNESWSMFEDKRHQWITFHPAQRAEPHWVARFDRRVSRVTVFCKARPAKTPKGRPVLDLPVSYPLDQLLLMYFFARRKGLLTHAAGITRGGKAFIFPGASGAGKSTFSDLLARAGAGKMLSDERVIVREIKGKMIAFGTPWAGTAGIARAGSAPLAGIFFLKHGKSNRIQKLDPVAAADRLLPMASVPWYDLDATMPIIAFAKRVTAKIPCYEFNFTPSPAAVDHFRKFLTTAS